MFEKGAKIDIELLCKSVKTEQREADILFWILLSIRKATNPLIAHFHDAAMSHRPSLVFP